MDAGYGKLQKSLAENKADETDNLDAAPSSHGGDRADEGGFQRQYILFIC
jgi:hypothetical protein